jgi:hypothetical protein
LAVHLAEQPGFRISGAEEAVRLFTTRIEDGLHEYEPQANEIGGRVADIHTLIRSHVAGLQGIPSGSRRGHPLVTELVEAVRVYPTLRFQSLLLRRVTETYVNLRSTLNDQLRELHFCRARLGELLRAFEDTSAAPRVENSEVDGRRFFPTGCQSLDETVRQSMATLTDDDLAEFDARVQGLVEQQFSSLVQVCLTPSNLLKNLEELMQREAEAFVEGRLAIADVAEMYLASRQDEAETLADLMDAFEEAAPPFAVPGQTARNETCLLAVPPGPSGERFVELTRLALPEVELATANSADDIIFYREAAELPLTDLEQFGRPGQEAYRQMSARDHFTPHTRNDITEWRTATSS